MTDEIILFKALSSETRLKIIRILMPGERCVCEIVPELKSSFSNASIQLGKLEDLGILSSRRDGKKIIYKIKDKKISEIIKFLDNQK